MPAGGNKPTTPPIDRFTPKVKISADGCWVWQAQISKKGYGRFFANPKMVQAHRWSYEYHIGNIPEGLQIDHKCRNRACVNPAHLEPVTNLENCRRGLTGHHMTTNPHNKKEFCKNGHKIIGKKCRVCNKKRSAEWYSQRTPEWFENYNRKRREARKLKKEMKNG